MRKEEMRIPRGAWYNNTPHMENRSVRGAAVTAIVPALNEEKTVGRVVRTIREIREVSRVIVVDDGSTDKTAEAASEAGAELLRLPENRGKGSALAEGVARSEAEILLFADADLTGFTESHIRTLLDPILGGASDMVIGTIDRGAIANIWVRRFESPFSGIRALRREIWDATPRDLKRGFEVDAAITVAARRRRLRVRVVTLVGLHHRAKPKKRGLVAGWVAWTKMWGEILLRATRFLLSHTQGQ